MHDLSSFITPSSLLGVLYQLYCEASFLKCVMLICVKNCKKSPAKLFMVKMKPFNLNKDHLRLIHYAVMVIPCSLKTLGMIQYLSVKYPRIKNMLWLKGSMKYKICDKTCINDLKYFQTIDIDITRVLLPWTTKI